MSEEEVTAAFLEGLGADKGFFVFVKNDNVQIVKLKTNNIESLGLIEIAKMLIEKQLKFKEPE